jgi:ankyrin repeat protein
LWFATVVAETDCHDAETLRAAAESGNVAQVVRALDYGVATDAPDGPRRMTPLMYAARCSRLDVARVLLSRGANVNATCRGFGTPLAIAAAKGHAAMVQFLLDNHADPNLGSPDGFTPLMHAGVSGDVDTVRLLIEAGADLNAHSSYGHTALMAARWNGQDAMAQCLIRAGAIDQTESD